MRKTIFVVLLAVVAIVLTAFVGMNSTGFFGLSQADEGTVQIGVMLPLSGELAPYGESMGTALELGREQINEKGGILGKKIEFVIEDSFGTAAGGTAAINSLANLKGMKIIIAADGSGPALAGAPIAEKAGAIYLVTSASNPDIKYAGDYVFRIAPSDDQQGKDLARLVRKEGFGNTAVLFMDNAYGEGIAKVFIEEFGKLSGKITESQRFSQADTDFRTQLLKMKEAMPDSLLIIAYTSHYPLIIKQMHELGLEMQVFATDTFKDEAILEAVGDKADGIIFTRFHESGSGQFNRFKEDYKQKYGKEYGPYGDYAYDGLFALKAGIEQANSFDSEVLKESLYSLEYNGITGLAKFDEFGEVDKPSGTMIVRGGKFVEYEG